jgi:hypothetical protein
LATASAISTILRSVRWSRSLRPPALPDFAMTSIPSVLA